MSAAERNWESRWNFDVKLDRFVSSESVFRSALDITAEKSKEKTYTDSMSSCEINVRCWYVRVDMSNILTAVLWRMGWGYRIRPHNLIAWRAFGRLFFMLTWVANCCGGKGIRTGRGRQPNLKASGATTKSTSRKLHTAGKSGGRMTYVYLLWHGLELHVFRGRSLRICLHNVTKIKTKTKTESFKSSSAASSFISASLLTICEDTKPRFATWWPVKPDGGQHSLV